MNRLLILAFLSCLTFALSAQTPTALDYFVKSPDNVASGVPRYARLDMADYYTYGSKAKVENKLGQKYALKSLVPEMLVYADEDSVSTAVCVLPTVAGDTVLMVIRTIPLPQTDSEISFFDKSWRPLASAVFRQPKLDDWLAINDKQAKQELENTLPFTLVSASYDPSDKSLTLTNESQSYFYEKEQPQALEKMRKQLRYVWNGKKFIADGSR